MGKLWEIQRDLINHIMKVQGFRWRNLAYNKTIKHQEHSETKRKDRVVKSLIMLLYYL